MKTSIALKRVLSVLLLVLLGASAAQAQSNHVVISQVYGGGGNSGATYRYDFVELYNPTAAAVDLSNYTIQYGSATSTSATGYSKIQLSGSVAAGKYYLAQLCIGNTGTTNGALLPTPDFTAANADNASTCAAPALAAGAGRVFLVSNTTTLTGVGAGASPYAGTNCPTANLAAIVDFIGYGSTANCTESTSGSLSRTADLSATKGAIRNSTNDDTNNNGTDFAVVTPAPRNSGTSTAPTTSLAIASSSANPASITAGSSTTLSVTVTPGTGTTAVTATVNLSSVGGSAAQALAATSTANVYSYTLTTSGSLPASSYSLPVTVTDNTNATATGNIALTVTSPVSMTPISTIQANRATYVGTTITFRGIITVLQPAGFYMQTASSTPGSTGDEGIYVYSGTNKNPATAVVGNDVTVTGTLTQYPLPTASHTPSLEVTGASLTLNSTGNALPAAIAITAPTATGDINQLRKYESMLVSLPSMTAVGGTDATLVENTETTTSSGQFYVTGSSVARPFREPGMDFRDYNATTCPTFANCPAASNPTTAAGQARPANVVLYDDNPERLIIESSLGGGNAIDVTAGAVITGATGVVDYTYSTDYPYGDPARIILTAANRPAVTASPLVVKALPLPGANQFTVAAFNVERFFDTNSANNVYYNPATGKTGTSSAVNVTADAYSRRLKKFSLAVRTVLNNPDIISVEEVENIQVLKNMAAQIDADSTGTKPGYVAYGTDSTTTFTNDVGGISIGFLVKPSTVNVTAWEQKGTQDLVAGGGSALNDRPSQVLHATINRGTGAKPYPITVISNHLRSLNAVNTATVQSKKELQAEMLANLIQGYQQAGEHVIAVGDMNAFEFSDGYTDTLGTITGNLSPAGTSVTPGKAIVNPVATDLVNTLPAGARQSYTEWGNAQVLDHAVVTADIAGSSSLQVGHIDADFPVALYNDATTPAAMSDHDPLLAYLALPAPISSATLTGSGTFANSALVGATSAGQQITLTNTGEAVLTITGFTVTGDFAQTNNCGATLAVGATCAVNVVFKPTAAGTRTGSLTLNGSATVAAVTLTGTAVLPPDFSLTDASNNTTTAVTLTAGGNTTLALKLTSLNGFAGTVTLTCTTANAPTGVACTAVNPPALTAGATVTANVVLTTVSRTIGAGVGVLPASLSGRMVTLALALLLCGVALMVGRKGRAVRVGGLLMMLVALTLGVTGCGDKASTGGTNPSGTPAGTYTYTVTATSGTLTHSETITLTVQ